MPPIVGKVVVADGSTLIFGSTQIRLLGFEAPKLSTPMGRPAQEALERFVRNQAVTCYRRVVNGINSGFAQCLAGDRDLSEEMLRSGYGQVDRASIANTEMAEAYLSAEQYAKNAQRGIWDDPAWLSRVFSDPTATATFMTGVFALIAAAGAIWAALHNASAVREAATTQALAARDAAQRNFDGIQAQLAAAAARQSETEARDRQALSDRLALSLRNYLISATRDRLLLEELRKADFVPTAERMSSVFDDIAQPPAETLPWRDLSLLSASDRWFTVTAFNNCSDLDRMLRQRLIPFVDKDTTLEGFHEVLDTTLEMFNACLALIESCIKKLDPTLPPVDALPELRETCVRLIKLCRPAS